MIAPRVAKPIEIDGALDEAVRQGAAEVRIPFAAFPNRALCARRKPRRPGRTNQMTCCRGWWARLDREQPGSP